MLPHLRRHQKLHTRFRQLLRNMVRDLEGKSILHALHAGLLGYCNHVTAMLFRVESAVRSRATKPSSTSMLACWNVPAGCKTTLVHKPLADMTFHKHHYKKEKLMLKTLNVAMTITKVLMLLKNMRPFSRIQRNIGHFCKMH